MDLDLFEITEEVLDEAYNNAQTLTPGAAHYLHREDFILQFLMTHPGFDSTNKADALRYYFTDGRKSAEKLRHLIDALGFDSQGLFRLLEFASGYGCVTRHIPVVMPNVDLVSSDIHEAATNFITEELGGQSALSHNVPEAFEAPGTYDIVFALSFFSHMPRGTWMRWAIALYNQLKPGGCLLFTTQGQYSLPHMHNPEIPEDGFWFKTESEQKDLDVEDYGQTIVTIDWAREHLSELQGSKIEMIAPGFWWDHQDLYVVRKEIPAPPPPSFGQKLKGLFKTETAPE